MTSRSSLLHDYANRIYSVIKKTDFPPKVLCQPEATPDVLDIVVVNDFVLPVHLTLCTTCSAYFQNPMRRRNFTRMDWPGFQACVEGRHFRKPVVNGKEAIERRAESLTNTIQDVIALADFKRQSLANRPPPSLAR